jgi:PAS domain S-box-containing protein
LENATLAGVLSTISQGVLVAGPDRKILFSNRAFLEITGFDEVDIIGRTCRIMQGRDTDLTTVVAIDAALNAGVEFSGEILNYRKTGEPFWNDLTISPQLNDDGTIRYFVGVTRDITERKLADLKIAKLEADYRFIFENVQCGVVLHRSNTEIIYANPMAYDLFGVESNDTTVSGAVNGDPRWALFQENGEALPLSQYPVTKVVSSGMPLRDIVFGFKRLSDGKHVWLVCNAFPVLNETGSVIEVLTSFTDITLQRELNEKLRQSQKLEATGQLTGGVAHDFNNLLLIISGNAELLAECDLPPEARGMVEEIAKAAANGSDLTGRLLSFARKQPLEPKALAIADHLVGVGELIRRVLPESISIEVLCDQNLWLAHADPGQLENALINLVVNARDAMPGGGTLTVEATNAIFDSDQVLIEPNLEQGEYVQISVTDNGSGMPPEVLAQAFDRFSPPSLSGKALAWASVWSTVSQSSPPDTFLSIVRSDKERPSDFIFRVRKVKLNKS